MLIWPHWKNILTKDRPYGFKDNLKYCNMCAINGFTFEDRTLINRMNDHTAHRGPDGSGVFVGDGISLGHRRLSIIDLSQNGVQPMWNVDKTRCIVFNGEIYNFRELRTELEGRGYAFASQTDTEVVLHAFSEWGIDCVLRLNGMFAFAIWDRRARELFLARDPVGVKPLYYYQGNEQIIFSSEIKAILAHPLSRAVDTDALNLYLRLLYVPAPLTMFKGIRKLKPGTYLQYTGGKLTQKKYWQPSCDRVASKSEARRQIYDIVKDSVRRQLVADRPVGVFLSGGIDSTIITGVASEIAAHPLQTFSVRFNVDHEKFTSDAVLAKRTSEYFGTRHHEFLVTGEDVAVHLESVVAQMDEPISNTTQIATSLLAKHTRAHVVVALGGDGGDELFGGYERYRLSRWMSRYQQLPGGLRRSVHTAAKRLHMRRAACMLEKLDIPPGALRYLAFMAQKEADVGRFLAPGMNYPEATHTFLHTHFFDRPLPDAENELMWGDIQSWLPDESLMRSDKMTMLWGLEQRVPLLDHRLVELSLRIPSAWKLQGGRGKAILTQAMRAYIPDYVLRQPKHGWFSPTSVWLRGPLKQTAYEILSPTYAKGTDAWFDFAQIRTMLDDHVQGRAYHMNLLWAMLTFQIWYRRYITQNV